MTVTTPTFTEEINEVFGSFITDGRIQCSEKDFKRGFRQLKKQLELGKRSTVNTGERKKSLFMMWLNTEQREALKDEFFGDFDSYSDWTEDGIREYYKMKSLPTEKLEQLIAKKKQRGEEIKKPRLMALITIKAGLIWSEMTEDEKNNVLCNNEDINNSAKKKGRPAGYKATNFVVDSAVESALNNKFKPEETDEEVELDEIEVDGKIYFKDEEDNIYDEECIKIGVLKNGKISE